MIDQTETYQNSKFNLRSTATLLKDLSGLSFAVNVAHLTQHAQCTHVWSICVGWISIDKSKVETNASDVQIFYQGMK